eukprot:9769206-Alexandrium_andersonii.AAC.1
MAASQVTPPSTPPSAQQPAQSARDQPGGHMQHSRRIHPPSAPQPSLLCAPLEAQARTPSRPRRQCQ